MIRRLLRTLILLFVCFCVATVLAQAVVVAYMWSTGRVDRDLAAQLVSVLQGIEMVPAGESLASAASNEPEELPTLDDVAEGRAMMLRDLELREDALRLGLVQLEFERGQFTAEKDRFELVKQAFENDLDKESATLASRSEENVREVWEAMKPRQVKDQILLMLEDQEIEKVVSILAAMPIAKRAKIVGEFKTADEQEKLAEIFRLMREGLPGLEIIEKTREELERSPVTAN